MYRGRFAPSPTGPLHFGSLLTALASYLEARQMGGQWLVRIEDTDTPRTRPEAALAILSTLDWLGFRMDGPVIYQSERSGLYRQEMLRLGDRLFGCGCSRKLIVDSGEGRYPGTCRAGIGEGKQVRSWRVRVDGNPIEFVDGVQGVYRSNLEQEIGDFAVMQVGTGIFSYQLAVVVDDEVQGITHVVRGADLLDSTPRQIYLQRLLGYREMRYLHIPVATGVDGEKLSKQNLAPAIDGLEAAGLLWDALRFLGQEPPHELRLGKVSDVWEWAAGNWKAAKIPARLMQPAS